MTQYSLEQLLELMAHLRHPVHGCPWDQKQTLSSIVPHTLEEAYEVADAIERGDMDDLVQELGDLLFQSVFYAQIAQEKGDFDFGDIISALVEKLLRRHPHVFPDGSLQSAGQAVEVISEAEIKTNWERIKQQERDNKDKTSLVDDVPRALPALTRAHKLQKRVAQVGFDWDNSSAVMDKVEEEVRELREALSEGQDTHIAEELGDLLFSCTNLARHLGLETEGLLAAANNKFERRFRSLELRASSAGLALEQATLEQMEALWVEAKKETS